MPSNLIAGPLSGSTTQRTHPVDGILQMPTGHQKKPLNTSKKTVRVIKSNLVWAFAYNAAAIPLAASGRLNPMWAGLAMACSSVFVVMNSLRLRRVKLRHR